MEEIIKNSSDFLFIYEAIQCNPNGDPDQENKPRMDYDTSTNLVTDTRIKRYIRDYLKSNKGMEIFVDMEGERQVTMEKRLENIIKRTLEDPSIIDKIFDDEENKKKYKTTTKDKKTLEDIWKALKDKKNKEFNVDIIKYLVRNMFFDIRAFGSAFAIEGFNKSYTGPIQLNWGFSFNKVELIDSSSIVTIMNDDNSTFGKDYRVYYSLIGFNGSINSNAANTTGLTENDLEIFRDAIWNSIPANPSRSKLNQFPKIYLELVYNEGITNGQFGDLRNYVDVKPIDGIAEKQIRKFTDMNVTFERLKYLIQNDKKNSKKIKEIKVIKTDDIKTDF